MPRSEGAIRSNWFGKNSENETPYPSSIDTFCIFSHNTTGKTTEVGAMASAIGFFQKNLLRGGNTIPAQYSGRGVRERIDLREADIFKTIFAGGI